MNEYKDITLDWRFFNWDKFKERNCQILINMIHGTRLGASVRFNKYCICEFDENDSQLKWPHIIETEKFNRLKTNCLEFNMEPTECCPYNKVFIYHTICSTRGIKPTGFFGYILYNTETKDYTQVANIGYDFESLVKKLQHRILKTPGQKMYL